MAKKIGYIVKDRAKYVSVTDVFEYLYEQGVIDTEKRMFQYRWNYEQMMVKRLYDCYKSGEIMDCDVPFIIDNVYYCHWLRFKYTDLLKSIRAVRNESELKKLAISIDLHDWSVTNKVFIKKVYSLK